MQFLALGGPWKSVGHVAFFQGKVDHLLGMHHALDPPPLPTTIKISRAPLHNEVTIRTGLWEGPKLYRISHVAGIRNIGHKHFPISSQAVMILDLVLCYSSTTLYFPRTTYIISSNIASFRQTSIAIQKTQGHFPLLLHDIYFCCPRRNLESLPPLSSALGMNFKMA